jgi:hypothetical protein
MDVTFYYVDSRFGVVSFENSPQDDINADAKLWTPMTEEWNDCPGSTGIAGDVVWGTDYHPITPDQVPAAQDRLRAFMARQRGAAQPQGQ